MYASTKKNIKSNCLIFKEILLHDYYLKYHQKLSTKCSNQPPKILSDM